jgi:hypothetical protein
MLEDVGGRALRLGVLGCVVVVLLLLLVLLLLMLHVDDAKDFTRSEDVAAWIPGSGR